MIDVVVLSKSHDQQIPSAHDHKVNAPPLYPKVVDEPSLLRVATRDLNGSTRDFLHPQLGSWQR